LILECGKGSTVLFLWLGDIFTPFSLSIPGTCGLVVVVVVGMKLLYYAGFAADIALCNFFIHFF
jgi:hypothetical protein